MQIINGKVITFSLVDNFGCTRSPNEWIDTISYHCFIENCVFDTVNLGALLDHADLHKEKWFGFCYACNAQVYEKRKSLLMELEHLTKYHKLNENGTEIIIQVYEDERAKLQEAVDTTRAQHLSIVDDTSELFIKPWNKSTLKTKDMCKKMLSKSCLFALYKCMDINCAFATSSAEFMVTHLQNHDTCSSSEMDNPTEESPWLECAYCDLISDSSLSLVQHIRDEHSSSVYQCPFCFYRSCTASNVIFHLKQFHKSLKESVLVCNGKERLFTSKKSAIEMNRCKNIRPLRCSEDCSNITYVLDYFINHITNSTSHGNNFKCQFCGSNIPITEAIQHLLCHNIGVYQCIYCIYGNNDIQCIQSHMCNTHPTQLPYICVRLIRKNRNLRNEEISSVESTMISLLDQIVDSKFLEKCSLTDQQLSNDLSVPTEAPNRCIPIGNSCLAVVSNNPASECDDELNDILSFNDLEKDYSSDDWDKYFATRLPPQFDEVSEIELDVPECHSIANIEQDLSLNVLQEKENHNSDVQALDLQSIQFDETTCNSTPTIPINESEHCNLPDVIADENANMIPVIPSAKQIRTESICLISDDEDENNNNSKPNSTSANKKPSKRKKICKGKATSVKHKTPKSTKERPVIIEPNLTGIVKYSCAYCPKYFEDPEHVFKHWQKEYNAPNRCNPPSFMFRLKKIFRCCYCRHCNTYDELKRHCEQKHKSNKVVAMVDNMNPEKCGLCFHQFSNDVEEKQLMLEIIDHFEEHHTNNNTETSNIIKLENYLTDELLDQILAEGTNGVSQPTSRIMYGCPGFRGCMSPKCKETNSDQLEIAAHMRTQIVQFQCKFCEKRLTSVSLIREHHKIIHKTDDETYRNIDVREDLDKYLEMQIIFPNGLLLTKKECENTRFGSMDEVMKIVEELNDSELEAVRMRQEKRKAELQALSSKSKKTKRKPKIGIKRVPLKPIIDKKTNKR